jgi:hypothetical protein
VHAVLLACAIKITAIVLGDVLALLNPALAKVPGSYAVSTEFLLKPVQLKQLKQRSRLNDDLPTTETWRWNKITAVDD